MQTSSIVELRQYTLHAGRRDELIELFEREFIEPQQSLGIELIGLFRDLDRPDRFVWLRGFPNMPHRREALQSFYGGPIWKAHRDAANATMIDSDNVLLLRPAGDGTGFSTKGARPASNGRGLVVATIYYLRDESAELFAGFFDRTLRPILSKNGGSPIAWYVTEDAANNFAALPVREGENVFVSFAVFPDALVYQRHLDALAASERWNEVVSQAHEHFDIVETLRLEPTLRSQLQT